MVITKELHLRTKGHCDIVDITSRVGDAVAECGLREGIVSLPET